MRQYGNETNRSILYHLVAFYSSVTLCIAVPFQLTAVQSVPMSGNAPKNFIITIIVIATIIVVVAAQYGKHH